MSSKKSRVNLFWPEERIEALKIYAADTSEPDDAFERSKRLAWMREFCMAAPSWLVADSVRLRLKVRAQDALVKAQAAQQEIEDLLGALEAMAPLEKTFEDRWAARIVGARHEPPKPAQRPELDPERDTPAPKMPVAGQKLPGEVLFDLAHGGAKDELPLRERMAKTMQKPEAVARVVGRPQPQVAYASDYDEPDEHQVHPNPDEEEVQDTFDEAPEQKNDAALAERQAENAADAPAVPDKKTRVGFRKALEQVAETHGKEVADFLATDILRVRSTTERVRKEMKSFAGTFASRAEAARACAEACKLPDDVDAGQEFASRARYICEHEDGRCSWWRR